MSILLFRNYKVSEDASSRAAKIFLDNLKELDLIDSENKLKDDFFEAETNPDRQVIPEAIVMNEPKNVINKQLIVTDSISQLGEFAPPIPVFLKGENRIAKVYLPFDFMNENIEHIIKVMGIHKRPE